MDTERAAVEASEELGLSLKFPYAAGNHALDREHVQKALADRLETPEVDDKIHRGLLRHLEDPDGKGFFKAVELTLKIRGVDNPLVPLNLDPKDHKNQIDEVRKLLLGSPSEEV